MGFKISVIIPFYNGEKYFKKAFDSLLNQSIGFDNIEVILINDCSKDKSLGIARDYAKKYDNCKFIDLNKFFSKNSGFAGRPRNYGLKEASGEYIVFLDIDDTYCENAFKILYNSINNNDDIDLVTCNYFINSKGNIIKNSLFSHKTDNIIVKPLDNQKVFNNIANLVFITPCAKIFKTSIIKENNLKFIEDGAFEDADFYFKYLIHTNLMSIRPNDYIYSYNEYSDSTIHNHNKNLFITSLKSLKKMCNFLDKNYNLTYKIILEDCLSSLLLIFINTKESNKCKKKLLQMLYEFEKDKTNIKMTRMEVKLLNNLILKEKFNLAILLSNIYYIIYNNGFIKNIYRKFNGFRRNKQ